jgi:hypothetical protein
LQACRFLFQRVHRRYQAAKPGRVVGTGPGSTSALWDARNNVKHSIEARMARSRATARRLGAVVSGETAVDRPLP